MSLDNKMLKICVLIYHDEAITSGHGIAPSGLVGKFFSI